MTDQVGAGGLFSGALSHWRMAKALPHLSGQVLDIGCGNGSLARYISSANYLGMDWDAETLDAARRLHSKHKFVRDIPAVGCFDCICLLATIEHLDEPEDMLHRCSLILADFGKIVLTTPVSGSNWIHRAGSSIGLFSRVAHEEHKKLYGKRDLKVMARKAHLRITGYKRFMIGANQLVILERDNHLPNPTQ